MIILLNVSFLCSVFVVDERHPNAFAQKRLRGALNIHSSLFSVISFNSKKNISSYSKLIINHYVQNDRDKSYFLWQKVKERLGEGSKIETIIFVAENFDEVESYPTGLLDESHSFVKFIRTTPGIAGNAKVIPLTGILVFLFSFFRSSVFFL